MGYLALGRQGCRKKCAACQIQTGNNYMTLRACVSNVTGQPDMSVARLGVNDVSEKIELSEVSVIFPQQNINNY
jgi:hypothetical protein